MTIFDLLLILLALATAGAVVAAFAALLFRRWAFAAKCVVATVAVWLLYLGVGTLVAVNTPQHILKLGEDRCFDEMCFAVTGWNRTASKNEGMSYYLVYVRISNRSRSHAQRENGRTGVLVDRTGHVYQLSPEAMRALASSGAAYPGLDSRVGPGQSLETTLAFELPEAVDYPGFALSSNLALNPARLVIGDEDHFLHWPTVVPLD